MFIVWWLLLLLLLLLRFVNVTFFVILSLFDPPTCLFPRRGAPDGAANSFSITFALDPRHLSRVVIIYFFSTFLLLFLRLPLLWVAVPPAASVIKFAFVSDSAPFVFQLQLCNSGTPAPTATLAIFALGKKSFSLSFPELYNNFKCVSGQFSSPIELHKSIRRSASKNGWGNALAHIFDKLKKTKVYSWAGAGEGERANNANTNSQHYVNEMFVQCKHTMRSTEEI